MKLVAAAGRVVLMGGLSCVLLGIGPLRAQPAHVAPSFVEPGLPPYAIMSIVRSTGLTPMTRPMRRGPNYVLVAVDRAGRQMRVVIDARLGNIVNMRPAFAAAAPYGRGIYGPGAYGYGAPPPYEQPPYGQPPYEQPPYAPSYGRDLAPPGPPSTDAASPPPASLGGRPGTAARNPVDPAPPPPAPQRQAANPKLANAPTGAGFNIPDPPAPPLPRPRPALASNGTADGAGTAPPAAPVRGASPAPPPAIGTKEPAAQIE